MAIMEINTTLTRRSLMNKTKHQLQYLRCKLCDLHANAEERIEQAERERDEARKRVAELEREKDHANMVADSAVEKIKELEAIIGRIQSNRGDETEVDALCDEALGKDGE